MDAFDRCPVWVRTDYRAREQLAHVGAAAVDVTPDVVGVASLEGRGTQRVPGENESPKPGANRSSWASIAVTAASVSVDPFGTCVYAHNVCLPAGARVTSKRLC